MAFYSDMASMVSQLLAPDTAGGLGQTGVVLHRVVYIDGEEDWSPKVPRESTETLRAAASGAVEMADGVTILADDTVVVASVPSMNWRLGAADKAALFLSLNGGPKIPVISATQIPKAGTPVAIKFVARGGA